MLLEAMVAIISLCCVMALPIASPELKNPKPNYIYATGIGSFLGTLGVPAKFGISFGLMAFTTFVYDTLDVCTRLGRYILQELTGWQGWRGADLRHGDDRRRADVLHPPEPRRPHHRQGRRALEGFLDPLRRQQSAPRRAHAPRRDRLALADLRAPWVWAVTGLPTAWMYVMSVWALGSMTLRSFVGPGGLRVPSGPVPWVGLVLIGLASLMLVEGIRVVLGVRLPTLAPKPSPAATAAS